MSCGTNFKRLWMKSTFSVTIQMKATEQYFPVALFMLYNVAQILGAWMKPWNVTIPVKLS